MISTKLQPAVEQRHLQLVYVLFQADVEPICIDSDENDHAAGSVPAGGDGVLCIFRPDRKADAIAMTKHDLAQLDDREMLNDTVIDFMIK